MVELDLTPIRVLELWLHSSKARLFESTMQVLVRLLQGVQVKARRELAAKFVKLEEYRHRLDGLDEQVKDLEREVATLGGIPHVRLVAGVEISESPSPAVKRKAKQLFRRAQAQGSKSARAK